MEQRHSCTAGSFLRGHQALPTILFTLLAILPPSAGATLGGDLNSIIDDQKAFNATLITTHIGNATEYVLNLPDGGTVHEAIGDEGVVFEVRWDGKGHRPDMEQLLGTFVGRFSNNKHKGGPLERQLSKTEGDFVMHSSVRNRHFQGRAYIPSLIPKGHPIN